MRPGSNCIYTVDFKTRYQDEASRGMMIRDQSITKKEASQLYMHLMRVFKFMVPQKRPNRHIHNHSWTFYHFSPQNSQNHYIIKQKKTTTWKCSKLKLCSLKKKQKDSDFLPAAAETHYGKFIWHTPVSAHQSEDHYPPCTPLSEKSNGSGENRGYLEKQDLYNKKKY